MRSNAWTKLMTAVLAGSLLLTGCNAGNKAATSAPQIAETTAKPSIAVPASFPSTEAKREWTFKAVEDGHYAEAKPLLEDLAAKDPTANTYAHLGSVCYQLKDYTGAVDAWTKAAELDSRLASDMYNRIGNAFRDTRKDKEAENAYRTALKLDPKQWNAATNLATMLYVNGNVSGAVSVLEEALPANKDVPTVVNLLASYKHKSSTNG